MKFGGFGGGGGELTSEQTAVIKSQFTGSGDEDAAFSSINTILDGLGVKGAEIKKKFRIPTRPGQDIIELDGTEY